MQITIRQITIRDVLEERDIKHVDYVSIDVEGYEMNVLRGIDFDKTDIICLSIENNKKNGNPDEKIRRYMKDRGYILLARISIDDIFVKADYWKKNGR